MILTVINHNHINVIKWALIQLSIRSCSHEPSVYWITTGVIKLCFNLCSEPSVYIKSQLELWISASISAVNQVSISNHNWSYECLPQSLQWTKCLSSHNWSYESLLQSLQWTKCLLTHNWSYESLSQSLQWTKCLLSHNWSYESQSLQCLSNHNWSCEVLQHCKGHWRNNSWSQLQVQYF